MVKNMETPDFTPGVEVSNEAQEATVEAAVEVSVEDKEAQELGWESAAEQAQAIELYNQAQEIQTKDKAGAETLRSQLKEILYRADGEVPPAKESGVEDVALLAELKEASIEDLQSDFDSAQKTIAAFTEKANAGDETAGKMAEEQRAFMDQVLDEFESRGIQPEASTGEVEDVVEEETADEAEVLAENTESIFEKHRREGRERQLVYKEIDDKLAELMGDDTIDVTAIQAEFSKIFSLIDEYTQEVSEEDPTLGATMEKKSSIEKLKDRMTGSREELSEFNGIFLTADGEQVDTLPVDLVDFAPIKGATQESVPDAGDLPDVNGTEIPGQDVVNATLENQRAEFAVQDAVAEETADEAEYGGEEAEGYADEAEYGGDQIIAEVLNDNSEYQPTPLVGSELVDFDQSLDQGSLTELTSQLDDVPSAIASIKARLENPVDGDLDAETIKLQLTEGLWKMKRAGEKLKERQGEYHTVQPEALKDEELAGFQSGIESASLEDLNRALVESNQYLSGKMVQLQERQLGGLDMVTFKGDLAANKWKREQMLSRIDKLKYGGATVQEEPATITSPEASQPEKKAA